MTRVEAYNILGDMWYEVTSKEKEAINLAQDAVQFVDLMPDDMVAVVRCKDCRFDIPRNDGTFGCYRNFMDYHKPDDFCSYGERKDDGE